MSHGLQGAPQRIVVLFLLTLLLAACGQARRTAVSASPTGIPISQGTATATLIFTPTPTLTATPTLTPTATPTPTLTPTPTALPLSVTGDLRSGRLNAPIPQRGAPCGFVDLLDFPMDPPDGELASGGRDFGVFRERYGKHHAGEDWWTPDRGSSFGQPVHSIGHGQITYAEPLGWNRDQGVVIIRHTFADGRTLLSFYGHLDPPSIVLQPGRCVARGEQIGQIGRPRSSPHLHFEIRLQSPHAPLSGYWPEDPTAAGWLPPSQTIWGERIAGAPGVLWTRPLAAHGTRSIGMAGVDTFVAIEAGDLVGIDKLDGRLRWRYAVEGGVSNAMLDARQPVIYLAGRSGQLQALRLPGSQGDGAAGTPALEPLWQVQLEVVGAPLLLPLGEGGVVVAVRQRLFAVNAEGDRLCNEDSLGQPFAWSLTDDSLLVSTTGGERPLWQIGTAGPQAWAAPESGYVDELLHVLSSAFGSRPSGALY